MEKNFRKLVAFTLICVIIYGFGFDSFILIGSSLEEKRKTFNLSLAEDALSFNETNAYEHIVTQLDFGFRVPGTTAHVNCGNWISNQLQTVVDPVMLHDFRIQKNGQPSYDCQNILGKMNTDKEKIVILSAHWDSRNVAEKDLYNRTQPIPGANDGGSGVGVLLELARLLSLYKSNLNCQIWFLFLDAEDQGSSLNMYGLQDWDWAEGSKKFASEIDEFYDSSAEGFECFILLDMVGGTYLEFVKETRSDEDLHNSIFNEGRSLGYNQTFPSNPDVMSITDDHLAFYNLGIPVIDLIIDFDSGNWLYHHTHSDDLNHIDPESLNITGRTVESFIKRYYTIGANETWKSDEHHTSLKIDMIIVAMFCMGSIIILFRRKFNKLKIVV